MVLQLAWKLLNRPSSQISFFVDLVCPLRTANEHIHGKQKSCHHLPYTAFLRSLPSSDDILLEYIHSLFRSFSFSFPAC